MSFPLTQAALHSHWLTFEQVYRAEIVLYADEWLREIEPRPLEFHKTGFRTPRWR